MLRHTNLLTANENRIEARELKEQTQTELTDTFCNGDTCFCPLWITTWNCWVM